MGLREIFVGSGVVDSMKAKYVGTAIRALLLATGVLTTAELDDNSIAQLSGALVAIVSVGWGMYEKRQTRAVVVTALGVAQITENEAKALVASPAIPTPPVTTPPNVVPVPVPVAR